LRIAAVVFGNRPGETMQLIFANMASDLPYAVGRAVGSAVVGYAIGRVLRGRKGSMGNLMASPSVAGLALLNFSAVQVGMGISTMDKLFTQLERYGIAPSALSDEAVTNVFLVRASDLNVTYNEQNKTVEATYRKQTVTICTFNSRGKCQ
jgi:hypothetical protein